MSRFSTNLSPAISHLAQELRVWPWQGKYVEQNRSALVEQTLVFLRHITEEQQSFDINLGPLSPDQCLGLPFPTNPRKAAILIRFCSWPLQAPPSPLPLWLPGPQPTSPLTCYQCLRPCYIQYPSWTTLYPTLLPPNWDPPAVTSNASPSGMHSMNLRISQAPR